MNEEYPPVRFKRKLRDQLQEWANAYAQEVGLESMSIAEYTMIAASNFEKNRNKRKGGK